MRVVDRLTLQPAEGQDLGDAAVLEDGAVMVQHLDRLVRLHRSRFDAAGDDAAEERVGFEDGADHAERAGMHGRRRHMAQHRLEQRRQALVLGPFRLERHPAVAARAVEDREVELLVGGVERGEQVEHLVDDLDVARIRPVDLVDRHDRPQPDLQRLADHELGLRHRAFGGVDQHDGAVDHVEDALHLAAEIGVARRVDDVDAGILPHHRGRLGEDGDAALFFQVAGIHGALGDALVFADRAGLLEERVDQRGFAMVDMRDDRDIAEIHAFQLGRNAGAAMVAACGA